jgi:hypothetical protein
VRLSFGKARDAWPKLIELHNSVLAIAGAQGEASRYRFSRSRSLFRSYNPEFDSRRSCSWA